MKAYENELATLRHLLSARSKQLEAVARTNAEVRQLRSSLEKLATSGSPRSGAGILSDGVQHGLDDARSVVVAARAYWATDENNVQLVARLDALEQRVRELDQSRDVEPEGAAAVMAAVVRIGAATLVGACVGAPIGAFVVGDAVIKEMIKSAIAAFVAQTAMELTEAGIHRVQKGRGRSPLDPDGTEDPATKD